MLRNSSRILIQRRLISATARHFSSDSLVPNSGNSRGVPPRMPRTSSSLSHETSHYKWLFAALGSFGVGFMIDKFIIKKEKTFEEKSKIDSHNEAKNAVQQNQTPQNQESHNESKNLEQQNQKSQNQEAHEVHPITIQPNYSENVNNLVIQLTHCQSDIDLERLLYGKDNNAILNNYEELHHVLNTLYSALQNIHKNLRPVGMYSTYHERKCYFNKFFEDSIIKYVKNYEHFEGLIKIKGISQDEILRLFKSDFFNFVNSYEKFISLSKEIKPREILNNFSNAQINELFFKKCHFPLQRINDFFQLDGVYPSEVLKVIESLSDQELRTIVNTPEKLIDVINIKKVGSSLYDKFSDFEKTVILNKLGNTHLQNLFSSLPPLQKEDSIRKCMPPDFIQKNGGIFGVDQHLNRTETSWKRRF